MPAPNNDRYQALRSQILANAYFVYPKKAQRSAALPTSNTLEKGQKPDETESAEEGSQQQSLHTSIEDVSTQSSQPLSSFTDVETWPTHQQDLEVVVCRYIENDSFSSNPPERFYAVVYDKNMCSGYGPLEQERLSIRQRHKLKGLLLSLKPVEDCASEEEALLALCKQLERDAEGLVLNKNGMARFGPELRTAGGEEQDHLELHTAGSKHAKNDAADKKGKKSHRATRSHNVSPDSNQSQQGPGGNSMDGLVHTSAHNLPYSQATESPGSQDTVAYGALQEEQLVAKYAQDDKSESSDAFETMPDTHGKKPGSFHTIPTQPLP